MRQPNSFSRRGLRRALATAGFVCLVGTWAAQAADSYTFIDRLGLTGGDYTGPGGIESSRLLRLNSAGFAAGVSDRYVGARDVAADGRNEQAGWLRNVGRSVIRVGFHDAVHTRDDGRQETYVLDLNLGGVTVGYSARFKDHAYRGTTAWVEDRWGNIVRIGYYDAAHTWPDGSKLSRPVDLDNRNRLVGYSQADPGDTRSTAWLATSTGRIQRIGFTDAAHTAPDGSQHSRPVAMNDAGYVVGLSMYHPDTSDDEEGDYSPSGNTAWVRTPGGSMLMIGDTAVNKHDNGITLLTESGYIAGWSNQFTYTLSGRVTWLAHVDGTTVPVGIADGYLYRDILYGPWVDIVDLNEAGVCVGESHQFPTRYERDNGGTGTWMADFTGRTVLVGLYDGEHTTWMEDPTEPGTFIQGEHQENHALGVNEQDAAIGYALRFDPTTNSTTAGRGGASAWVATLAGETTRLGLTDAAHTRADGYRYSIPRGITASKYVWGHSERYEGGMEVLGRTSWIYDRQAGTYTILDLSDSSINRRWAVDITEVEEDTGRVFGNYHNGDGRGYRAFTYMIGGAFVDLDSLVVMGDPAADGLDRFASASQVTPNGYVAGRATRTSGLPGAAVYLVKRRAD